MFFVLEADFLNGGFIRKTLYIIVVTSMARWKYYTAWIMADSIANASGLGFNGYKNGVPQWDKCSNVVPIGVEVSSKYFPFRKFIC